MSPSRKPFGIRALLASITLLVTGLTNALALDRTAPETDREVLTAERTLRAAELRETDDTTTVLYQRASDLAESILARNPNSCAANFVYFAAAGRILLADGATKNLLALRRLDKDYLDRAIQLDPNYANALAAKGGVLLDLPTLIGGDPKEALRLLRRANEINPSGVGTRVNLAKALARNGKPQEAYAEAKLAAHYACRQGRRKALDEACELMDELDSKVARAQPR